MSAGQGQVDSVRENHSPGMRWPSRCTLILLLALLIAVGGCARINLPAIDPNGSRIFLPFPNTTTLAVPRLHGDANQPGIVPQSAFPTPLTPAPCVQAAGGPDGFCNLFSGRKLAQLHEHFAPKHPGKSGEIQLVETRFLAPVGGEVVLLAGLCGKDGYLVKRQPLEWMLSPDSVGQFIEVGDDMKGKLCSSLRGRPKVEKLDVDFAHGRTSSRETTITRGTPSCDDDIFLAKGLTWLSISSPSEGVSRVTVLAPESEIWDQRRQTATIYWVDVDSQMPKSQVARTGETIELVTRVTRSENFVPATGWIVQYTIVDPSIAAFPSDPGKNVTQVLVDQRGNAPVRIVSQAGARGTTPVVIEIIRPEQPSDNLPALPLGRGQAMVTFSSPGLELRANGPPDATPGQVLTYNVTIANPGDLDAENVQLRMLVPAGTRVLETIPKENVEISGGRVWDQGVLPAHQEINIVITLQADSPGVFDLVFNAIGDPNLNAESKVRTEVTQPEIDVRFEPDGGIAEKEVGEQIVYEIDVVNRGRQVLVGAKLLIESDTNLDAVMPEQNSTGNKVEQEIPTLQPGASFNNGISFVVRQQGKLGARLRVLSSSGAVLAERNATVVGKPPREKLPRLETSIRFNNSMTVGQKSLAQIEIVNRGEVPLTGITANILADMALQPSENNTENHGRVNLAADRATVIWSAPDLNPGEVAILRLSYLALNEVAQAAIQVAAQSKQGVSDSKQIIVTITRQVDGAPVSPQAPATPRSGKLQLSVGDTNDPVSVGGRIRYFVRVTNDQDRLLNNILIRLTLPQGSTVVSVSRGGEELSPNFVRGQDNIDYIIIQTINTIRPDETIDYSVELTPKVPQQINITAQAISVSESSIVAEARTTTTVQPAN